MSKWLNAAVVVADSAGKKKMEALPYVQKVQWVAKGFISRIGTRLHSEGLEGYAKSKNGQANKLIGRRQPMIFKISCSEFPTCTKLALQAKGLL